MPSNYTLQHVGSVPCSPCHSVKQQLSSFHLCLSISVRSISARDAGGQSFESLPFQTSEPSVRDHEEGRDCQCFVPPSAFLAAAPAAVGDASSSLWSCIPGSGDGWELVWRIILVPPHFTAFCYLALSWSLDSSELCHEGSIWRWPVWVCRSSVLIPGSVVVCVTQSPKMVGIMLVCLSGEMWRVITGETKVLASGNNRSYEHAEH